MYATFSIPVARLADRWSRRNVVALAVTVWSIATMTCGLAQNFAQLFLARVGVGFGEAGGTAPSNALISDLFPSGERGRAMAIFVLASPLGMASGLLFGGWIGNAFGWRTALIFAGAPGLFLGLLLRLTVTDSRRAQRRYLPRPHTPPLGQTIKRLWAIESLRYMVLASTLQSLVTVGFTTWMPAYLARSRGLDPVAIGAGLAAALGIGLTAGTLIGGRLIDVLGRSDLRWHFWVPATSVLCSSTIGFALFLVPTPYVFWLFGLQIMLGAVFSGPFGAIVQNLVSDDIRATASACTLIVINVVALGIGPQGIGLLSDFLRPRFEEGSLGVALAIGVGATMPAALLFILASRNYRSDLRAAASRRNAFHAPAPRAQR
jgi:MFS family permease